MKSKKLEKSYHLIKEKKTQQSSHHNQNMYFKRTKTINNNKIATS